MRRRFTVGLLGLCLAAGMLLTGCQTNAGYKSDVKKAICVIQPTTGNQTKGWVSFTQVSGGILVVAEVEGLSPGSHGFHIHQFGDCSSGDGKSAGGHFNPHGKAHGGPDKLVRHVGDLGNLEADEAGKASYYRVDNRLSLEGRSNIIGRGIIIHAKVDDLNSQPTGAAGARVGCGVIGVSKK